MYRVLKAISWGKTTLTVGSLVSLNLSEEAERALVYLRRALSPVAPPPLDILPGWKVRARRLGEIGVGNVLQLLEADASTVAKALRTSVTAVRRWQDEAKTFLVAQPNEG